MSEPIALAGPRRRAAASGDDAAPPRPPAGICPEWWPLRGHAARRVLRGGRRPAALVRVHPGQPHLAAALDAWTALHGGPRADRAVVLAALDLLDGTVCELPDPAARRAALALAAGAAVLAGRQVHLICLAEPTARRLHALAAPLIDGLGARCALLTDAATLEERISGHRAEVVVASAGRLAQDMLRDHELLGGAARGLRSRVRRLGDAEGAGAFIRGTPMALVDDADLVMVESPRPVGFSADPEDDANRLRAEEAFVVLRGLQPGVHYATDPVTRRITLSDAGEARLDLAAALFEGPWQRRRWREETILAALTVRDFFRPGQDYRVEQTGIVLAREPSSSVEPGIAALVAAKERLGPGTRLARLWNYRRLLSGYAHLAGIGMGTAPLAGDFRAAYGLRVRRGPPVRDAAPDPAPPEFRHPAQRRSEIAGLQGDAVLWVPTAEDARALGIEPARLTLGDAVFAIDSPAMIVQLAAAQENWERRLRAAHPDATIRAFAGADDGLFGIVDAGDTRLSAFRDRPSVPRYRAAQAARAAAATARRAAHLRSDRYFERVLAFAGEAP